METKTRRFTWFRYLIAIVMVPTLFFIWFWPFSVGQFYEKLDSFSGTISRGEQLAAREGLKDLQYFYDLNAKLKSLKLDWVASKYLFKNAVNYEVAFDSLTGRSDRVDKRLKYEDNFWAYYMRGNAKWRIAQSDFRHALTLEDAKLKEEEKKKADDMAASTKDDYERAIKSDPAGTLPPKWNYDLVTNPAARAAALGPKPVKVRLVLGEGGKGKKGLGDDKGDGLKGKGLEDLKILGPPKDAKSQPGTRRPG